MRKGRLREQGAQIEGSPVRPLARGDFCDTRGTDPTQADEQRAVENRDPPEHGAFPHDRVGRLQTEPDQNR